MQVQPRTIRDQTFEVNFVEYNCDEESEGIENESLFLNEEILILEYPLKKGNLI